MALLKFVDVLLSVTKFHYSFVFVFHMKMCFKNVIIFAFIFVFDCVAYLLCIGLPHRRKDVHSRSIVPTLTHNTSTSHVYSHPTAAIECNSIPSYTAPGTSADPSFINVICFEYRMKAFCRDHQQHSTAIQIRNIIIMMPTIIIIMNNVAVYICYRLSRESFLYAERRTTPICLVFHVFRLLYHSRHIIKMSIRGNELMVFSHDVSNTLESKA